MTDQWSFERLNDGSDYALTSPDGCVHTIEGINDRYDPEQMQYKRLDDFLDPRNHPDEDTTGEYLIHVSGLNGLVKFQFDGSDKCDLYISVSGILQVSVQYPTDIIIKMLEDCLIVLKYFKDEKEDSGSGSDSDSDSLTGYNLSKKYFVDI
jgi:hypothetical protein